MSPGRHFKFPFLNKKKASSDELKKPLRKTWTHNFFFILHKCEHGEEELH